MKNRSQMKFSYLLIALTVILTGFLVFSPSVVALDRPLKVGDKVIATADGLRVRDSPAGNIIGQVNVGMGGTITAGPVTANLNGVPYVWWKVSYCDGKKGWSAQNWLAYLPSTIRVKRATYGGGQIETVGIRDYVKNVLPNEVYPSWKPEALKANAMAVKTYGWWRILHPQSTSFDVYDDTRDQIYKPGSAKPSTSKAVDDIWPIVMTKNQIFMAQYIDGCPNWLAPTKHCTNEIYNGRMSQWGTQQLANQGKGYQDIIRYYYGNIPIRQLTLC